MGEKKDKHFFTIIHFYKIHNLLFVLFFLNFLMQNKNPWLGGLMISHSHIIIFVQKIDSCANSAIARIYIRDIYQIKLTWVINTSRPLINVLGLSIEYEKNLNWKGCYSLEVQNKLLQEISLRRAQGRILYYVK